MILLRKISFIIFGVVISSFIFGQVSNLGLPYVTNFDKKETKAGTQTWAMAEDDFGYTWFANNAGLVRFDGYYWDVFRLPDRTIVRSLAVENKSHTIYLGGQGDFGYFKPDKKGNFIYHSLGKFINEKNKIGDVWNTVVTYEGVYFRTDNQLFRYFNGKVTAMFPSGTSLNFIGYFGNELLVQDSSDELYLIKGGKIQKNSKLPRFDKGRISGIINYHNDTILITTINNGIFSLYKNTLTEWKTSDDNILKSKIIFCASLTKTGKLALGTSFAGLILIDNQRRIEANINKNSGLQNNSVLSILASNRNGNIWLGLDYGIDQVNTNSHFRYFYPDNEFQGTGYAVQLQKDKLYCGTNTGLYAIKWKKYYKPSEKNNFTFIKNSNGQVWDIQKFGEDLWMSHHEGVYLIQDEAKKIGNLRGVWKLLSWKNNALIIGHYKGLSMLNYVGGKWEGGENVKGFDVSARLIEFDREQRLWIAHPYRGVYKIDNSELEEYNTTEKMLNTLQKEKIFRNHTFKIGQNLYSSSGNKLFKLSSLNRSFEEEKIFSKLIPIDDGLKFIIEDKFNNIWYGSTNETGVLKYEKNNEGNYKKYIINELNEKLTEGFQKVLTINDENTIIPTQKGFLLFDLKSFCSDTSKMRLKISKIILKSKTDSVLYAGSSLNEKDKMFFKLNHTQNNLDVHFLVLTSLNKDLIQFSHKIKGISNEWSNWSYNSTIPIYNLAQGKYIISTKARSHSNYESNEIQITVEITPPWYKSIFAYIIYTFAFLSLAVFLIKKQKEKHELEKENLKRKSLEKEKEHLVQAEKNKAEIIKLQNEKLHAELSYKNQELTSFTYHLVTKNELITEIKKALIRLEPKFALDKELKKEFKNIIHLTEKNDDIDSDWENFIANFDQVHSNFFKRLNEEFPTLSPTDYKMCTYLRMNLSTKDISSLMNISTRSVETNRYRLRKKLNLASEINLVQFLTNY